MKVISDENKDQAQTKIWTMSALGVRIAVLLL
jgi:hypothetical protein